MKLILFLDFERKGFGDFIEVIELWDKWIFWDVGYGRDFLKEGGVEGFGSMI